MFGKWRRKNQMVGKITQRHDDAKHGLNDFAASGKSPVGNKTVRKLADREAATARAINKLRSGNYAEFGKKHINKESVAVSMNQFRKGLIKSQVMVEFFDGEVLAVPSAHARKAVAIYESITDQDIRDICEAMMLKDKNTFLMILGDGARSIEEGTLLVSNETTADDIIETLLDLGLEEGKIARWFDKVSGNKARRVKEKAAALYPKAKEASDDGNHRFNTEFMNNRTISAERSNQLNDRESRLWRTKKGKWAHSDTMKHYFRGYGPKTAFMAKLDTKYKGGYKAPISTLGKNESIGRDELSAVLQEMVCDGVSYQDIVEDIRSTLSSELVEDAILETTMLFLANAAMEAGLGEEEIVEFLNDVQNDEVPHDELLEMVESFAG